MKFATEPRHTQPIQIKGRGAASNPEGRFQTRAQEAVDDGWTRETEPASRPGTQVTEERVRSIISRNDSPDIPFAAEPRVMKLIGIDPVEVNSKKRILGKGG